MSNSFKFWIAVIGCELIGILGTPFTLSAIPTWYATLEKPFFSPPNWVFGPVWTILYFLMGISAYLIWKKKTKKKQVKQALTYFCMQLFLNFTWSILFFGFRSPILGLLNIIALLFFIYFTMQTFTKLSKPSAYLLVPYFIWVCFATLLNTAIVLQNPII